MTCVVLILCQNLQVRCFESCPDRFKFDNRLSYDSKGSDGDNGFYDWLRDASGSVIGVRWFPYDEAILRELKYINKYEYIELSSDFLELKLFFSSNRIVDETRSADQDFLENNIYYSEDGEYAISFSMDGLNPREKSELCSLE